MSIATPSTSLQLAALTLLLRHQLSHCGHAGLLAADLLQRLADCGDIDADTALLCEQASCQLYQQAPASR